MYAVVATGGKQVRVEPGRSVRVERLPGEVGEPVALERVLFLRGEDGAIRVGRPVVEGARVRGTITAQGRGPKLRLFKMRRRKGYRLRKGHRQEYTELRVEAIEG